MAGALYLFDIAQQCGASLTLAGDAAAVRTNIRRVETELRYGHWFDSGRSIGACRRSGSPVSHCGSNGTPAVLPGGGLVAGAHPGSAGRTALFRLRAPVGSNSQPPLRPRDSHRTKCGRVCFRRYGGALSTSFVRLPRSQTTSSTAYSQRSHLLAVRAIRPSSTNVGGVLARG